MSTSYIGIRRLAATLDVTAATVRRWERQEKLPPAVRGPGGQRLYDTAAVARLVVPVFTRDVAPPPQRKPAQRGHHVV